MKAILQHECNQYSTDTKGVDDKDMNLYTKNTDPGIIPTNSFPTLYNHPAAKTQS